MACKGGSCSSSRSSKSAGASGGKPTSFKLKGGGRMHQVPTVTPQQASVLSSLLSSGQSDLGSIPLSNFTQQIPRTEYELNPYQGYEDLLGRAREGFDPIAQQAREDFTTQTIPGLAERFTALGSGGSQNSSAFQGALGAAGSGLERQLAAMRVQYGQQNLQDLLGFGQANRQYGLSDRQFELARRGQGLDARSQALQSLQLGMTPQFESVYQPKSPSFWQSLAGAVAPAAVKLGGQALMGGLGMKF